MAGKHLSENQILESIQFDILEDFCPKCKERIFGFNPLTGKKGPFPNQCQFSVVMSNGSRTEIGLCKDCFAEIKDEEIRLIFEAIKRWWATQGFMQPLLDDYKIMKILRETVW